MPNDAYLYLKKGNQQVKDNNVEAAIQTLVKGSDLYPDNYQLHSRLVEIAMKKKNWALAIRQWESIYRIKDGRMKRQAYLGYTKALHENKEFKTAEKILIKGLYYYPDDRNLVYQLADNLTTQKKWKKAAKMWDNLFDKKDKVVPVRAYVKSALSYRKTNDFDKADKTIEAGIENYPKNKSLYFAYADLAIFKKNWSIAINRLDSAIQLFKSDVPMDLWMKKAMINQIIGNIDFANQLYKYIMANYKEEINRDKEGYRKIVFYNNGESRIEFFKKLKNVNTAVITFDSLNMVWKNPSFGFKLLSRQDVDIIAVRKKNPHTFHQDLSIDAFYHAVKPMINIYKHKVAYGYSLGGYTSLYYGASIDCTVLSLAPRLSIHPKYGKTREIGKYEFHHSLSHPFNSKISPIIVYDPKEKMDNAYVNGDLIRSYPNAIVVEIPYGGHGIAPHLLRMGLLKEFILTVIDNKVPKYDRTKKAKSNIYFRVLGQACLKRNKVKWACDLVERSLELLPKDKYAIKLKTKVLEKMGKYNEAIQYVKNAIELVPKVLDVRLLLLDLYLKTGDLKSAESEIDIAIKEFGEKNALIKRKEKLKQ